MPGHGIAVFEDVPTSGLPINVPNGVCGLNGLAQVAAPQLALAVLDADVGVAGGVASLNGGGQVPIVQLPAGVAGGVATLDGGGQVPLSQLGNVPAGTGSILDFADFTGGNISFTAIPVAFTDIADGAGFVEATFVLAAPQDVEVNAYPSIAIYMSVFGTVAEAYFTYRVDGVAGTVIRGQMNQGTNPVTLSNGGSTIPVHQVFSLGAGAHTIRLMWKGVWSDGGGGSGTLFKDASTPLSIIAR
jgi:hypothetical protein